MKIGSICAEGKWSELSKDEKCISIIGKIETSQKTNENTYNSRKITIGKNNNIEEITNENKSRAKFSSTKESGKLIDKEWKETGKVSWKVYKGFFVLLGIPSTFTFIFCLFSGVSLNFICQWWLSKWANTATLRDQQNPKYKIR